MGKKASTEKQPHIIESVRAAWPGSYTFRIQSFSLITKFIMKSSNAKCFESPEFESNGLKWKLSFYPNGKETLRFKNHLSMYLVAVDDDIDTVESGINVTFTMFVYDHIRDNFLTIQDNEVRRFHRLNKEWGFARLISAGRFKNAENGYLMNDCCMFGVEIFVISSTVRSENLTMIKHPSDGTFTWKLDNFSTLSGELVKDFKVNGQKWKLEIYPNGILSGTGTHLSMYLQLNSNYKTYLRYVLRVRDQIMGQHYERTADVCFTEATFSWGYPKFISLTDLKEKYSISLTANLKEKSIGYILNDSIIFEVEIILISA